MAVTELKKLAGIAAICVVGGCVGVADKGLTGAAAPDFSANKSADDTARSAAADNAGDAGDASDAAPLPFLTYEWNTGFSGFLSPPIEVRRAAKNDCIAEGYELAVVETMTLNGDVATAIYLCQGDTE